MENGKWKMQNAKSKMQHTEHTAQSKRQNHKINGIQDPRSGIFHTPPLKKIKDMEDRSGHQNETWLYNILNFKFGVRTCVLLLSITKLQLVSCESLKYYSGNNKSAGVCTR